jgi:hypothetical protein
MRNAQWIEWERRGIPPFEGMGRESREEEHMKTLKWTQRICIGSGLALASMFAVPAVAGADSTCYTGCVPATVLGNSVTPTSGAVPHTTAAVNGSSSLPFTGADIGELAAVGAGAIVVGGILARRRRQTS